MNMIPVTKPYLPPRKKLDRYLDRVFETHRLTNEGPLVSELTDRLSDYLGVSNLLLVANGTLALQVAYAALGVKGRALTTPFTFPATSSALSWQGIEPVYADIDENTLNLRPANVQQYMEPGVSAIIPVHTYGNPCDVDGFDALSNVHGIPVIYDGSHAFGVRMSGNSILLSGSACTLSFHATKLFHTVEGGAIAFRDRAVLERARRMINFGFERGNLAELGINAKMSEMHAAMGLAVLDDIDFILSERKEIVEQYSALLTDAVTFPDWDARATRNGAYAPILLGSERQRDQVQAALLSEGFESRSYFSPSLDTLGLYTPVISRRDHGVSDRILCLPVFVGLGREQASKIAHTVLRVIEGEGET